MSQIFGVNLVSVEAKGVLDFWYAATSCYWNDNVVLDIALRSANISFLAVNAQNGTWKESPWHKYNPTSSM